MFQRFHHARWEFFGADAARPLTVAGHDRMANSDTPTSAFIARWRVSTRFHSQDSKMVCILQLRNKSRNVKIQLSSGEIFHAFSCVLELAEVRKSMRKEDDWAFWPDGNVAVHKHSIRALNEATKTKGITLQWSWDNDILKSVEVHAEDGIEWDDVIVNVVNASVLLNIEATSEEKVL